MTPLSSKSVPSGGAFYSPQYFYIFFHMGYTGLLSCCAFCGLATHAVSSSLLFFFSTSIFGYFHLGYLIPQHLKHFTSSIISCLLTFTFSSTLHCITLLAVTSNLFWGIGFPFSSCFLFLQLQARCPNLLHSNTPFLLALLFLLLV